MDPEINDLDASMNLDPYTAQWVTAVGGYLGCRLQPEGRDVALTVEAGYTVSYVPTAAVRRTLPEYQVVRADYGLNVFRLGVGLTLPL